MCAWEVRFRDAHVCRFMSRADALMRSNILQDTTATKVWEDEDARRCVPQHLEVPHQSYLERCDEGVGYFFTQEAAPHVQVLRASHVIL